MVHQNCPFNDEQLDKPVEKLRECLRDLNKIVDRPTALASRERCKNWMQQAVNGYNELRREYEQLLDDDEARRVELEDLRSLKLVVEHMRDHIADFRRGLITLAELETYTTDYLNGDRRVTT